MTTDFREATWGMTKLDVILSETEVELNKITHNLDPNADTLAGTKEANVGNYKALIEYNFEDGKLECGHYYIKPKANSILDNYIDIVEMYTSKYGSPLEIKEEHIEIDGNVQIRNLQIRDVAKSLDDEDNVVSTTFFTPASKIEVLAYLEDEEVVIEIAYMRNTKNVSNI